MSFLQIYFLIGIIITIIACLTAMIVIASLEDRPTDDPTCALALSIGLLSIILLWPLIVFGILILLFHETIEHIREKWEDFVFNLKRSKIWKKIFNIQ